MGETLLLPPRALVPKPDADDPIDYYYKPFTARLYRARLEMAVDLLGTGRYPSLLEVGFGSGSSCPSWPSTPTAWSRSTSIRSRPRCRRCCAGSRSTRSCARRRSSSFPSRTGRSTGSSASACSSTSPSSTARSTSCDASSGPGRGRPRLSRAEPPHGRVLPPRALRPARDPSVQPRRHPRRRRAPSGLRRRRAAPTFRRSFPLRSRPTQAAGAVPAETGVVLRGLAPAETVAPEEAAVAEFFDGFAAVDDHWRRRNRGYRAARARLPLLRAPGRERPRDRLRRRGPPRRTATGDGLGVDVSAGMIELARSRHPEPRVRAGLRGAPRRRRGRSTTSCSRPRSLRARPRRAARERAATPTRAPVVIVNFLQPGLAAVIRLAEILRLKARKPLRGTGSHRATSATSSSWPGSSP